MCRAHAEAGRSTRSATATDRRIASLPKEDHDPVARHLARSLSALSVTEEQRTSAYVPSVNPRLGFESQSPRPIDRRRSALHGHAGNPKALQNGCIRMQEGARPATASTGESSRSGATREQSAPGKPPPPVGSLNKTRNKLRRVTFLEAAEAILRSSNHPLSAAEIADRAIRQGLIKTRGRTPAETMRSALYMAPPDAPVKRIFEAGRQRAVRGSVRWAYARPSTTGSRRR
jgi:hypothetical protein